MLVILHLLCISTGAVNHGQKEEQTVGEVILIEISTLQGNNRYSNFIYSTIKKLKKNTDRIIINFKNHLGGGGIAV